MSGYGDPDEEDYVLQTEESKAVFYVLALPVAIGVALLVRGISSDSYIITGLGTLVLAAVPMMIYIAWRRRY